LLQLLPCGELRLPVTPAQAPPARHHPLALMAPACAITVAYAIAARITMSGRLALLVFATALWLACAGTAHACGVWSLRDKGQGWLVVFRATTVEVVHHPEEKRPRRIVPVSAAGKPSKQQDWRLMRFDPGRRQWQLGDRRAFSFKGGAIRLGGKQVGSISDAGIVIGKRHFLLAFGASYQPESSPYAMIPDNDGRSVTVSEGGSVILEGAAPSERHCAATNQIAMYLVWREVVMEKLLGKLERRYVIAR
jgi:hypothetical protein